MDREETRARFRELYAALTDDDRATFDGEVLALNAGVEAEGAVRQWPARLNKPTDEWTADDLIAWGEWKFATDEPIWSYEHRLFEITNRRMKADPHDAVAQCFLMLQHALA